MRTFCEEQDVVLMPEIGSEGAVSMFLASRRKLNLAQVRMLSARFKLPADVFLAEGD